MITVAIFLCCKKDHSKLASFYLPDLALCLRLSWKRDPAWRDSQPRCAVPGRPESQRVRPAARGKSCAVTLQGHTWCLGLGCTQLSGRKQAVSLRWCPAASFLSSPGRRRLSERAALRPLARCVSRAFSVAKAVSLLVASVLERQK